MKFLNGVKHESARIEYETVEEFATDLLAWTREGFGFSLSTYETMEVGKKPFIVQYSRSGERSSRAAFAVPEHVRS